MMGNKYKVKANLDDVTTLPSVQRIFELTEEFDKTKLRELIDQFVASTHNRDFSEANLIDF